MNSDPEGKIAKNGKAAALLLPIPPGKEEYAKVQNLCLEFYFSDTALQQTTAEGHGLKLRQPTIQRVLKMPGRPIIDEEEESDLPHSRYILEGKTVFAGSIVPSLDPSEFESFRALFQAIESFISHLHE